MLLFDELSFISIEIFLYSIIFFPRIRKKTRKIRRKTKRTRKEMKKKKRRKRKQMKKRRRKQKEERRTRRKVELCSDLIQLQCMSRDDEVSLSMILYRYRFADVNNCSC